MSPKMGHCGKCGAPRMLGLTLKWHKDGTIGLRLGKHVRMAIVEIGIYESLFDKVQREMGTPVKHIILEAQSKAAIKIFEDLPKVLPGYGQLKRTKTVKRWTVKMYQDIAALLGLGDIDVIEYTPGVRGIAKINHPHQLDMVSASIVGALEGLEDIPFDFQVRERGAKEYIITVTPSKDRNEKVKRLEFEFPKLIPGQTVLQSCSRCRVPTAVSKRFKWDSEKGSVKDKRTGARLHIATIEMITTVFRELAGELGDEVNGLLIEAEAEWIREYSRMMGVSHESKLEDVYRRYLGELPVYGRGNFVSMETNNGTINIVVENPFQPELLAGSLKGLYEVVEKKPCNVTWESPREGALAYTVEE